ncbi:chemotaxis protein CheW [Legionella tucsonensis]|uniref:Chemotaxis signal transduction protein (CheW domain) n=1 Tax=Legionella tucsonensis TaxID=40335 RepID=A0A0W0ZTM4_9GAMM|nr:chemotaxis protein CheW [Legionella tucsonensis]KTD72524.1 chemotaxis signal transduction protein (cheW domain) [Legionella tucsonensis]
MLPKNLTVLHFLLHDTQVCMDLHYIEKILPLPMLEIVPSCPTYFVGLMNLKNKCIPVLDLAICTGLTRNEEYPLNIPILLCSDRPLSKLAEECEVRGDAERRTGVYTEVHEDSSTASTKQLTSSVEFGKRSNETHQIGLIVDKVLGLSSIDEQQIEIHEELTSNNSPFWGAVTLESGVSLLLNINWVFTLKLTQENTQLSTNHE